MTGVFQALCHFVFWKDLSSAVSRQGDKPLSIMTPYYYILILKQETFRRGSSGLNVPTWTITEGAVPIA